MEGANFLSRFRDQNSKVLKHFTATQFAEIWNHYDSDGNGYIEGDELDKFLHEFVSVIITEKNSTHKVSDKEIEKLKAELMETIDENKDNKIELKEMAQILPTEENFFLIFHRENCLDSSVDFMKVWKRFDVDHSGYIEVDELKSFLKHLLTGKKHAVEVDEEKLKEYTKCVLDIFDQNKDGKLQLSEMARLLPIKENYLCQPIFNLEASKITSEDINKAFEMYDQDANGTLENEELSGFLKDLLNLAQDSYEEKDLEFFKRIILSQWDVNKDGKINRDELKMLLMQQAQILSEYRNSS